MKAILWLKSREGFAPSAVGLKQERLRVIGASGPNRKTNGVVGGVTSRKLADVFVL